MSRVRVDPEKTNELAELLISTAVPPEQESASHSFTWSHGPKELANCYLAIVAICHQTSPVGERRLEGYIQGTRKLGWDYLKEKLLLRAVGDNKWASPLFWRTLSANDLSELYRDEEVGLTLNRVAERAFLINDLGRTLHQSRVDYIEEAFDAVGRTISGCQGFLEWLRGFEAYRDPVRKKAYFFLSLVVNECGWTPSDPEHLLSPIDYHELRGHLRVGTVVPTGQQLLEKVRQGLPLTLDEDRELRAAAQQANNRIAAKTGLANSVIHYLLWNIFRHCCPRESGNTHCMSCPPTCDLPARYKDIELYEGHCLFSAVCESVGETTKIVDPPHTGHFY